MGVPLIAPVELDKERPAGKDVETDLDMTETPLVVGVTVVIAVPLVSVSELGL